MKPQSFFIDSTDGKLKVFTTPSPKYPTNENPFDLHDAAYIAHGYSQALELAKKEAVEIDLDDLTTKNVLYYSGKYTISGWIVDTIYTINMEEEIEIVEVPADSGFMHVDSTSYPTFKKVARIK
jgi:hypothetical protein